MTNRITAASLIVRLALAATVALSVALGAGAAAAKPTVQPHDLNVTHTSDQASANLT